MPPSASTAPDATAEKTTAASSAPDNLSAEGWKRLHREFAELHRIQDPIERDYRLIQYAKDSEIPTDRYHAMFEAYQRRSARGVQAMIHTLARTASFLGQFTILAGLILFIFEADARKRESHAQAWDVIRDAKAFTESAGRIEALETLTKGCRYGELGDRLRSIPMVQNFISDCVSLRGLVIENAHLPNLTLHAAQLHDARMKNTKLWNVNFQNAVLQRAQMQRANLAGAQLQGADLSGAQLDFANLSEAQFECTDLIDQVCQPTILTDANLRGANLRGANLGNVDLTEADLTKAIYDNTTNLANLSPASRDHLEDFALKVDAGAQLQNTTLELVEIGDANLAKAQLDNANLIGVGLRGAVLTEASLVNASFVCKSLASDEATASSSDTSDRCTDLRDADLTDADLTNANLTGTDLTNADLTNANLTGTNLTNVNLNRADLRNVTGLTVEQITQAKNWALAQYDEDMEEQLNAAVENQERSLVGRAPTSESYSS
jgi:uncharacterized protein YjbI with pentapeptide repeats